MEDIRGILEKLDKLYEQKENEKIGIFLEKQIMQAKEEQKTDNLITLLNEMIGYCRDMGLFEKGSVYCEMLYELIMGEKYKDTLSYATTFLNIGNFKRAEKKFEEAKKCFEKVLPVYHKLLDEKDLYLAGYYNNLSLLYQETGAYDKAADCLKKALKIVEGDKENRIETATTYTNLANCYLKLKDLKEAEECLKKATALFGTDELKDYHYSGTLSAMAELSVLKHDLDGAKKYYEAALKLLELYTGKNTPQYQTVLSNFQSILGNKEIKSGLLLCREYFEAYGREMLKTRFAEYEDKITVGLLGEGSDCFGFDDEKSRDHDFGPRFCMWVSKETYDEIGVLLQNAYEKLPDTYKGYRRNMTKTAAFRDGVMILEDFLEHLLHTSHLPDTENDWLLLPENGLFALSRGEIWQEGDGHLRKIRESLKKYPDTVRRKKILQSYHLANQMGNYNYFRMKSRKDNVAAEICLAGYMEHIMKTVYYLNDVYPPIYKWLHRGMDTLPKLAEVMDILDALYDHKSNEDTLRGIFDVINRLLEYEMGEDVSFLTEDIIAMEWDFFDKVDNEGGRADCQDDYETFYIMRKSQYLAWNKPLLQSYHKDLLAAGREGRNLISEKYARMMESTCREEYDLLKDKLPVISPEKKELVDQIVKIQVGYMEEFSEEFPKVAQNARVIHSSEDTYFRTSYETYLRGEMLTYSDETIKLYGRWIVSIAEKKENPVRNIMENTVKMYGYRELSEI